MGVDVAEHSPAARRSLSRAPNASSATICSRSQQNGPEEKLRETQYSQPAIFVTNVALSAAVGRRAAAGRAARAIRSANSAVSRWPARLRSRRAAIVDERGLAMQDAARTSRAARCRRCSGSTPKPSWRRSRPRSAEGAGRVQLANFNSPGQIVISGDATRCRRRANSLLAAGAKRVVPLNVSGAWHSELMEPARERFAPVVEAAHVRDCRAST